HHEVLEQRLVGSKASRHFFQCGDVAPEQMRVFGLRLLHRREEIRVGHLSPAQSFAHRGSLSRARLAQRSASLKVFQPAGEIGDSEPQVLLAREKRVSSLGPPGYPTAREQVEHLPSTQPFTRVKGGIDPAARPLQRGELRVDVPFVGEIRGAPLLERKATRYSLDIGYGRLQLHSSLGECAAIAPCRGETGARWPREVRCGRRTQTVEPAAVE